MRHHKHPTTRGLRRAAAERRQAAQTRKYRRQFAYMRYLQPYHFASGVKPDVEALAKTHGRKDRDNRQPCPCPACGNARRHFGTPPIGELRDDLRHRDANDVEAA